MSSGSRIWWPTAAIALRSMASFGIKPLDTQACIDVIEECERLGVVWAISFDDSRRRWTRYDKYDALVYDSYMETVVDPELDYRSIEYFYKVYVICSSEEERRIASLSKCYGAFQPICRVR